jgi:thiol-disulfide isomerase/thioredoxin
LSAVREQGSLPDSLRQAPAWEKNVYEAEVGARAADSLAEEIGKSFSGNERNKLFFSRQGKEFKDVSAISGLDNPADGRVLSLWDFDRDGRQDFAVANANAPLLNLYRNEVPDAGNVIAFNFVGGSRTPTVSQEWGCRDGYGVKVKVKAGPLEILRELRCGEGMAAQNSRTLLVGIGQNEVESILVTWPSGATQEIGPQRAGTLLTVFENPAERPQGGVLRAAYRVTPSPKPHRPDPSPTQFPRIAGVSGRGLRLYTTMATWCASCKAHLPELRQLRESFDEDSLSLYGLPVDDSDDKRKLDAYRSSHSPPYRLLAQLTPQERVEVKQALQNLDALEALPSTVVTDSQGRVVLATRGLPSVSQLRALDH